MDKNSSLSRGGGLLFFLLFFFPSFSVGIFAQNSWYKEYPNPQQKSPISLWQQGPKKSPGKTGAVSPTSFSFLPLGDVSAIVFPHLVYFMDFERRFQEFTKDFLHDHRLRVIQTLNSFLVTLRCSPSRPRSIIESFLSLLLRGEAAQPQPDPLVEQFLAEVVLLQAGEIGLVEQDLSHALHKILIRHGRILQKVSPPVSSLVQGLLLALGAPAPRVIDLSETRKKCFEWKVKKTLATGDHNQPAEKSFEKWCQRLQDHLDVCALVHQNIFPPPEDGQSVMIDSGLASEVENDAPLGTYLVTISIPGTRPARTYRKILFYPMLSPQEVKNVMAPIETVEHVIERIKFGVPLPSLSLTNYPDPGIREAVAELTGRYLDDPNIQKRLLQRLGVETDPRVRRPLIEHFLNYLYGIGLYHQEDLRKTSSPLATVDRIAPIRSGSTFDKAMERFWTLGSNPKNGRARQSLSPFKFGYLLRGYPNYARTPILKTLERWLKLQCDVPKTSRAQKSDSCAQEDFGGNFYSPPVEQNLPSEMVLWAVGVLRWAALPAKEIGDKVDISSSDQSEIRRLLRLSFLHDGRVPVRAAAASALRGLVPEAKKLWFKRLPLDKASDVRYAICEQLLTLWPHQAIERELDQVAKVFLKRLAEETVLMEFAKKAKPLSLAHDVSSPPPQEEKIQKRLNDYMGRDFKKYKIAVQYWRSFELTPAQEETLHAQLKKEPAAKVRTCFEKILQR